MKTRFVVFGVLLTSALALSIHCGGGDSSSVTGADPLAADSTSDADSLLNALEGLMNTETGVNARLNPRALSAVGEPSVAACYYHQDVKHVIDRFREVRLPLCYMKAVEDAGIFSPGDGAYNYYKVLPPTGDESGKALYLRVGKFEVGGKRCLKFQECKKNSDSDVIAQAGSFSLCEEEDGVSANVVHKNTFVDPNSVSRNWHGSFSLRAFGEDVESITKASIVSAMKDDDRVGGDAKFEHEKDGNDHFLGCFSGEFGDFSHSGCSCVYSDGSEGTARVAGTDQFPEFTDPNDSSNKCPDQNDPFGPPVEDTDGDSACTMEYNFTESFAKDGEGKFLVAADSAYSGLVDECDIPRDPLPPSDFDESWEDCDGDFTEITLEDVDVTECIAMEEKGHEGEQQDNCFQQKLEMDSPPS